MAITAEYGGYDSVGLVNELTAPQYLLFRMYLAQLIQREKTLTKIFGNSSNEMVEQHQPENAETRLDVYQQLQSHMASMEQSKNTEAMARVIIPTVKVMFRPFLDIFNQSAAQSNYPSDILKPNQGEWSPEEAEVIDSCFVPGGSFKSFEEAMVAGYTLQGVADILALISDVTLDHDPHNERKNAYKLREWSLLSDAQIYDVGQDDSEYKSPILCALEYFCYCRVMHESGGGMKSDFLRLQAANTSLHIEAAKIYFQLANEADFILSSQLYDETDRIERDYETISWQKMRGHLEGKDMAGLIERLHKAVKECRGMMNLPSRYGVKYLAPYVFKLELGA